jgi:hypothetical protein
MLFLVMTPVSSCDSGVVYDDGRALVAVRHQMARRGKVRPMFH